MTSPARKGRVESAWLGVRSLLWTLLLPGMVAGYLPWRFFGLREVRLDPGDPLHLAGVVTMAVGAALLGACIWEFAHSGRGTLAPIDAPRELVVRGLYRYVRNPMYLSVATILLGELLLTRSPALLAFAAAWFLLVNLMVIGYEEPALRRRFGDSYRRYTRAIGRWLPSLRPGAKHSNERNAGTES
jgi:protein-S-isoprenylcysteine O-methyltransferase Ste14